MHAQWMFLSLCEEQHNDCVWKVSVKLCQFTPINWQQDSYASPPSTPGN